MFKKLCYIFFSLALILGFASANERIAGDNRYRTAIEISKKTYENSDYILMVNGERYFDAYAASALAYNLKAPILLTDDGGVGEFTKAEIKRLGAKNAILIGGENTLGPKIEKDLKTIGLELERISGVDRFETSLKILDRIREIADISSIMVARSEADALSSSAYRRGNIPLVLLDKSNITEVKHLGLSITALGGENMINNNELEYLSAERIAGKDRFETSKIIAKLNLEENEAKDVLLVNANSFIDALTVSSYAIKNNMNILLSPGDYIEKETGSYIKENSPKIIFVGGESQIASDTLKYTKPRPKGRVIDPNKPMLALTFDDGPAIGSTRRILDVLKKYDQRATFFVLGSSIGGERAKTLQRTNKEGHQIGSHSYSHPFFTKLSKASIDSELSKTSDRINATIWKRPVLFRPPYGDYNSFVRSNSPYPLILWSVDTRDWESRNADTTYRRVMDGAKDGAIILMHDIHDPTAEAVERIVPALVKKGFQLVTVSELFEYRGGSLKAGVAYSSAN